MSAQHDKEGIGQRTVAPVDWNAVRRRLEAAASAIEGAWTPGPAERQSILKARAKALAKQPKSDPDGEAHLDIVEFVLAHETYAVESRYVREVYPLKELTALPCTPPFVLGIANIRGQILSVIDIKKFFDLPEKGLTDLNKVIVIESQGMKLGILADIVLAVRSIPLLDLQPSLPTLTGVRAEYLRGVSKERTVVLDVGKILSDSKIVVHEQIEI